MIAVRTACVFGKYRSSADLAGKSVVAGVRFVVTLFKCFSFIFTVHFFPPESAFLLFTGGTAGMNFADLPVSAHSPS